MMGAQWAYRIEGTDIETVLGKTMKGMSARHVGLRESTLTLA